jgi:HEPN domain-containing protein
MPRKVPSPLDPGEWLRRARSNLARAKSRIPEACLEDLCFDSQQAAEKAIKAVFIHLGVGFPYIHDLAKLLRLLERTGLKVPKYVKSAKNLTPFAVGTRYPDYFEPVTEREYQSSVRIAEKTYQWAETQINKAPSKGD